MLMIALIFKQYQTLLLFLKGNFYFIMAHKLVYFFRAVGLVIPKNVRNNMVFEFNSLLFQARSFQSYYWMTNIRNVQKLEYCIFETVAIIWQQFQYSLKRILYTFYRPDLA